MCIEPVGRCSRVGVAPETRCLPSHKTRQPCRASHSAGLATRPRCSSCRGASRGSGVPHRDSAVHLIRARRGIARMRRQSLPQRAIGRGGWGPVVDEAARPARSSGTPAALDPVRCLSEDGADQRRVSDAGSALQGASQLSWACQARNGQSEEANHGGFVRCRGTHIQDGVLNHSPRWRREEAGRSALGPLSDHSHPPP